MADAGARSRRPLAILHRGGESKRRILLDAPAQRSQLRPALGIGDLLEFEPSRDAGQHAIGKRRLFTDEIRAIADRRLQLVVPLIDALGIWWERTRKREATDLPTLVEIPA